MATPLFVGGSFAPPLTAEKLVRFRELAQQAGPQPAEAMEKLCQMVEAHQRLAPATEGGKPHSSGMGVIIPLKEETVAALDQHVPWREELQMYANWFEQIPVGELRDAAHHLLWYAWELYFDREPMTTDKL
jgi:hypothetical protein